MATLSSHPICLVPTGPQRSLTCPSLMGYSTTTSSVLTPRRSYINPLVMRSSIITRPVRTICSTTLSNFTPSENILSREIKRSNFPEDFIFGAGSSSHQIEGGAREGGRGLSVWDTFTHQHPVEFVLRILPVRSSRLDNIYHKITEKIGDRSTADVSNDSYSLYKEDVHIMKNLGLDACRLSISWSRILPTGKISGGVNREGIEYYNNLFNELLENGITPFVTLFHWDLPQALEDAYGGFLSDQIVNDFCEYANLCFWEFGDRVKNWITLNEPWTYCIYGHSKCVHAPGGSYPWPLRSQLNIYAVTHNLLLAHANAAALYKKNYQKVQNGKIGIINIVHWFKTPEGHGDAGERATDFMLGWFMEPLTKGEYPKCMKDGVVDLPEFTMDEQKLLKGSCDFFGLNYYTAYYALDKKKYYMEHQNGLHNSLQDLLDYEEPTEFHPGYNVLFTGWWNGQLIGEKVNSWLHVCPEGIRNVLINVKKKYGDVLLYITENGVSDKYAMNASPLLSDVFDDKLRKIYIQTHLAQIKEARDAKVNVMGYFVWSLMDNFEWGDGYLTRFGLIYVDYKNNCGRHPKASALWYMNFLKGEGEGTTHSDSGDHASNSKPPYIPSKPQPLLMPMRW